MVGWFVRLGWDEMRWDTHSHITYVRSLELVGGGNVEYKDMDKLIRIYIHPSCPLRKIKKFKPSKDDIT